MVNAHKNTSCRKKENQEAETSKFETCNNNYLHFLLNLCQRVTKFEWSRPIVLVDVYTVILTQGEKSSMTRDVQGTT